MKQTQVLLQADVCTLMNSLIGVCKTKDVISTFFEPGNILFIEDKDLIQAWDHRKAPDPELKEHHVPIYWSTLSHPWNNCLACQFAGLFVKQDLEAAGDSPMKLQAAQKASEERHSEAQKHFKQRLKDIKSVMNKYIPAGNQMREEAKLQADEHFLVVLRLARVVSRQYQVSIIRFL